MNKTTRQFTFRARRLANLFKANKLNARECIEGTTTYENGNDVKITICCLADKRFGNKGTYRYLTINQHCFVHKGNDVVILAPHNNKIHVFYCEWDEDIDGHLPIYFLGKIKK